MICKVVTVFNEKGGSGKTTSTCQLAGTLGLRGYDILVADLDPQQTSSRWLARNGSQFPATIWPGFRYGAQITGELEKLAKKYQIIISDCAPSVEQASTWGTLLVSDLALIPTKLNPPDLDALPAAKAMARRVHQQSGRQYPIRVVANATRMHMPDDRMAMEMLLKDKEFPAMETTLGDRKAFTRSMLIGSTAHDLRNSAEAVKEIEALADAVLGLLGLPLTNKEV